MADVPIGVFLSGGIDSSCVAFLAQQKADRRLKTFSIAFEDPTFDESEYARIVARQIGSEHVEERLGTENQELTSKIEAIQRAPIALEHEIRRSLSLVSDDEILIKFQ